MSRLQGKCAVVLGAASRDNMGQVMARRFAAEGAKVVVSGRKAQELESIAGQIGAVPFECDITRKPQVEALFDEAAARFGKVDIAVNCTGWGLLRKLLDTNEDEMDRLSALQFKGPFFFLQAASAQMARSKGGSIIMVSSASVHALLFNHAAYIATKSAGEALVRCFANEFGGKGIRVNSIAPGLTATPMTENEVRMPGLEQAFLNEYPLGRIGTTKDVADAALWLAGDECFMTGQTLQINGGLTLRRNPLPWEINASMRRAAGGS
ncbi:MAG: SDR family oxidoreductase [Steroidobacteraceae bacterium]